MRAGDIWRVLECTYCIKVKIMICVFIIITPLLQLVSFMLKPLIIGKIWRGELSKKRILRMKMAIHVMHVKSAWSPWRLFWVMCLKWVVDDWNVTFLLSERNSYAIQGNKRPFLTNNLYQYQPNLLRKKVCRYRVWSSTNYHHFRKKGLTCEQNSVNYDPVCITL